MSVIKENGLTLKNTICTNKDINRQSKTSPFFSCVPSHFADSTNDVVLGKSRMLIQDQGCFAPYVLLQIQINRQGIRQSVCSPPNLLYNYYCFQDNATCGQTTYAILSNFISTFYQILTYSLDHNLRYQV